MNDPQWILPQGFDREAISSKAGFIYVVTNLATGRMYIGKKYTWAKRGKKLVQSNWPAYWGSSESLLLDIRALGRANFERRILALHETRTHTDFAEERELFVRNALHATFSDGSPIYYNRHIGGRWFKSKLFRP